MTRRAAIADMLPGPASSLADLDPIGAELLGRIKSIASDIDQSADWNGQPKNVRNAICILLAMARNRTMGWVRCEPEYDEVYEQGVKALDES
jgi:hypothetical protein